jgi:sugar fermentation stimulation protein A
MLIKMKTPILNIPVDATGLFKERPNRFSGIVDIETPTPVKGEMVHVHDPGRLRELLYPGNRVLLRKMDNPKRKTRWDIIAAAYDDMWVLVNSVYHRHISEKILSTSSINPLGSFVEKKAEVTWGHSRLDFVLTKKTGTRTWIEVKGCSLTIDGVALFPDAPTVRGTRHLETLIDITKQGEEAALIILVFRRDSSCFMPKADTDPDFAETFYKAMQCGVRVYPMVFDFSEGVLCYTKSIKVCEK